MSLGLFMCKINTQRVFGAGLGQRRIYQSAYRVNCENTIIQKCLSSGGLLQESVSYRKCQFSKIFLCRFLLVQTSSLMKTVSLFLLIQLDSCLVETLLPVLGRGRKVIMSLYLLLFKNLTQSNRFTKVASTEVACYKYCQNQIGKASKTCLCGLGPMTCST